MDSISRDILWIPYFSHFSVNKIFGKQKSTASSLNICKRTIIVSVSKSLNSYWGDHVDPSKIQYTLQCDGKYCRLGIRKCEFYYLSLIWLWLSYPNFESQFMFLKCANSSLYLTGLFVLHEFVYMAILGAHKLVYSNLRKLIFFFKPWSSLKIIC